MKRVLSVGQFNDKGWKEVGGPTGCWSHRVEQLWDS